MASLVPRQGFQLPPKEDVDFSSNSPRILAIVGTLTGLAGVMVLIRCYVRVSILRNFTVEDAIMVVSMICSGGVLACFVGESQHGLGWYMNAIMHEGDMVALAKWFWAHAIIIVAGISLAKISIGFFLLRFTAQKKFLRWFIIGSIVFLVLFTIASILTLVLQCIPIAAAWDFSLRLDAKCYANNTYLDIAKFNSSINIITDFLYATLPVIMFYDIQVNRRTKFSLMGILGLGYFACAAAIVKAVYQSKVFEETEMYRDADYHIWNSVELNVGIIAACFPTMKPLMKSVIGSTRNMSGYGTRTRKRTGDGYSHYGAHSHAMKSIQQRSRVDPEEHKYHVQIHAQHASLSGGSDGGGSEENLNLARHGQLQRTPSGMHSRIMQTTEVIVHTEDGGLDGGLDLGPGNSMSIGPRRMVEDRI
ncbi:hypothetical protein BJX61DRAFT_547859 [Aspergillus egyptiacus]|nr:hypothetical protein BJX61DRAFT_547859 [Aspergillus egyptiacus]